LNDSLYNINIERAVLSAIIFDPEIFEDIWLKLKPKDFYLPFHQYLFEAMEELNKEDKPIDEEFLRAKLQKQKRFDEVAMLEVLATNPISNTDAYVEEIKARSTKRSLATLATTIKQLIIEEDLPTDDVVNQIEKRLYEITQDSMVKDFRDSKDITFSVIHEIERLKALGNSRLVGIDTGFKSLNKKINGFGKGDLIIIAARPAMGKCLSKGTKVLMYSGELKKVEDIRVGDFLMGDDSTPRRVLSLARGREEMYWIRQDEGIDYRVNKSHILSLKRSRNEGKYKDIDILNISVEEYIKKSDEFKSNYKGYKVAVEFSEQKLEIEPYFLGLWLGNGDSNFQNKLKDFNLLNNKHIPQKYLINSRENRLKLLAGLVDSSGYYDDKRHVIEITQKSKKLAEQIKFLVDSLGFRCSLKSKVAKIKSRSYECEVYHICIMGYFDIIPTKVVRKQIRPSISKRDYLHTGIKVEYDGWDR